MSGETLVVAWNVFRMSEALYYLPSVCSRAVVSGTGRVNKPPLHPIPVQRAFQIVGLDVMGLPKTESGISTLLSSRTI